MPNRLCKKDLDARWLKKNGENHYGYKNHISIDKKYGIIRKYEGTDASVYDSKVLGKLIDIENAEPEIWADSAYRSEEIEWTLSILSPPLVSQIQRFAL